MLIRKCVCGNRKYFRDININDIELRKCKICRVHHQKVNMTTEAYSNFYQFDYHTDHQTSIGCQPYTERYLHDLGVANIRVSSYEKLINNFDKARLLDIGSGNGAFVDACREQGIDAYGIDLGLLGNPVYTIKGKNFVNVDFENKKFNVITMHDVFEHLVDPVSYLHKIYDTLSNDGYLVIDYPNYYVDAGKHHWRPIQHLWYMNNDEMVDLLEVNDYIVVGVHKPIASKVVFYCQKNRV